MLLSLLPSLKKAGCQPVLGVFHNRHCAHTEVAEAARRSALDVKIIECRGKFDWNAVHQIRTCMREGIDLIHTHGYKSDIYGYIANRRSRTPILTTQHSMELSPPSLLRLYRVLNFHIMGKFHKIVAVSESIAAELERRGVPPCKITTINNGIDVAQFSTAEPSLTQKASRERIIGLVGRLIPEKGGREFLHAAQEVAAKFADVSFYFIGAGPYRNVLSELAGELHIEQRVTFAGERRDMPGVYASLDMLVLPSISEGLPMTLLEALAAKRPVIATRVGGVSKVILHERTGLLVEPGDFAGLRNAMVRLLSDPALGRQLGGNGCRLIAQEFSAAAMAQKYMALYQALRRQTRENDSPDSGPQQVPNSPDVEETMQI